MNKAARLFAVENLSVSFNDLPVVDKISFDIYAGETFALVGESGSGKTLTALAPLRLEPEGAKVTGRIWWSGKEDVNKQTSRTPIDLLALPIQDIREIRGREIAMVFQEPMTALNPLFTVGNQIVEAVQVYQPLISKAD